MKIKEEQLATIRDQQEKLTDLVNKVGLVETQKHALLHEVAKVNVEIEDYKQEIEKEYGSISINLEDGTYSEINDPYGKNE